MTLHKWVNSVYSWQRFGCLCTDGARFSSKLPGPANLLFLQGLRNQGLESSKAEFSLSAYIWL